MGSKTRLSAAELAPGAALPLASDAADEEIREAPPSRARARAHVYVSALGWLLCAVVGAGIYSNVIADPVTVRERAAELARSHAGCAERCRVLHMEERRSVLGYRADYEMDGKGAVHVRCRRSAVVVGGHLCEIE